MDIDEIRLTNARFLADRFETLADFAKCLGKAPTQVSRFMGKNPTKAIGKNIAREIEEKCGQPRGWLDQDHLAIYGSMDQWSRAEFNRDLDAGLLKNIPPSLEMQEPAGIYHVNPFTSIPMVESFYHGGNGDGLEHPGEPKFLKSLSFRTDWLEYMGLDTNQLKVAMVHGKSMEPTLNEAEVILIDKRESDISKIENGAIYALVFKGKPLVKRVYVQEMGNVNLVSDNKRGFDDIKFSEEEAKEIEFIGRVVWRGGEVS